MPSQLPHENAVAHLKLVGGFAQIYLQGRYLVNYAIVSSHLLSSISAIGGLRRCWLLLFLIDDIREALSLRVFARFLLRPR